MVYSSLASQSAWCGCLESMRASSVEPNVVSATAADWRQALATATQVTRNAALTAFAQRLRWPQAVQLLQVMDPSAVSVSHGLKACEGNEWQRAVRLLLLMRHRRLRSNVYSASSSDFAVRLKLFAAVELQIQVDKKVET